MRIRAADHTGSDRFEDVYYFAYPCSSLMTDENGRLTPDPAITGNMFMKGAIYMSRYTGYTQGGFTKRTDVKPFYMELVKMIAGISE